MVDQWFEEVPDLVDEDRNWHLLELALGEEERSLGLVSWEKEE